MPRYLHINFFQIQGADFVCIPCRFTNDSQTYKLCWIRKISDHNCRLIIDYQVLNMVANIEEAKNIAKLYLRNYFIT